MKKKQYNKLIYQINQIIQAMLNKISPEGGVITNDANGTVYYDLVSNHHLIELLNCVDSKGFKGFNEILLKWMLNTNNNHPFTIDSFLTLIKNSESNKHIVDNFLKLQQKDGALPIYTAHFQGGDFFSTLWAVKILQKINSTRAKSLIDNSLGYLILKKEIGTRTISQKGFLLFVLLEEYNIYKNEILNLKSELVNYVKSVKVANLNILEIIDFIYILEDLQKYNKITNDNKVGEVVENELLKIFALNNKTKISAIAKRISKIEEESLVHQFLLKSTLVAIKSLSEEDRLNIVHLINSKLQIKYLENKSKLNSIANKFPKYESNYTCIEEEFEKYNKSLQKMWEETKSDYEHSIFLMMPFEDAKNYRDAVEIIKLTCKKYGFKVFRSDDNQRHPLDNLWDNLVLNMLSCKYGIVIYTSEKKYDLINSEPILFQNPNVALEFGFMKSRGKKTLILKDVNSNLYSDIQGMYW